jgi:hypothetical protein
MLSVVVILPSEVRQEGDILVAVERIRRIVTSFELLQALKVPTVRQFHARDAIIAVYRSLPVSAKGPPARASGLVCRRPCLRHCSLSIAPSPSHPLHPKGRALAGMVPLLPPGTPETVSTSGITQAFRTAQVHNGVPGQAPRDPRIALHGNFRMKTNTTVFYSKEKNCCAFEKMTPIF